MSEKDDEARRAAAALEEAEENYKDSRRLKTESREDVETKLILAEEAWNEFQKAKAHYEAIMSELEKSTEEIVYSKAFEERQEESEKKHPEGATFIKVQAKIFYPKELKVAGDEVAAANIAFEKAEHVYLNREKNASLNKPEGDPGWTGNH
jgi:GDP-D-mannose dehydratase